MERTRGDAGRTQLLTRPPLRALLSRWRQWDWIAAQRVDAYIANSAVTQARIRRYFGRESVILHPPVELSRFSPGPVGAHYLVLAELMAHKRIDVAVRAFNALGLPLVVVGDGPEWRHLRRLAGPTVRLTGRLSDGEVADLLRSARALVVTAEEEFGIAAVESLASGRPVIGAAGGRRARDGDRRAHRMVLRRRGRPGGAGGRGAGLRRQRGRPPRLRFSGERFGVEPFQEQLRAIVDERASGRSPRAAERPLGGLLPRKASRRGAESMRIR